jgi:hypothetical protein
MLPFVRKGFNTSFCVIFLFMMSIGSQPHSKATGQGSGGGQGGGQNGDGQNGFATKISMRCLCWLVLLLILSFYSPPALALCNVGVKAPSGTAVVGTKTATSHTSGTITVGPGGPIYVRVTNTGEDSASFGVMIRKTGASALNAYCNTAAVISPSEEFWLESKFSGDDQPARDVDVLTGVEGASLELTVFKAPNILSTTLSDTITIRLRAFIPNVHPVNPGFIRPVPGKPEMTMIPGPLGAFVGSLPIDSIKAAADCYSTDNRGFSSERAATSKVSTEFKIVVYFGQVSIEPSDARLAHRAGTSVRLNCSTGGVIAEKPGTFDGPFGVRSLGQPAIAETRIQVIGQVAVGNPHILGAPMIDYSFDFIYDLSTKRLTYSVTAGVFPAFELYAIRGSGTPITILQIPPSSEDAWGLLDGGSGRNTKLQSGIVQM